MTRTSLNKDWTVRIPVGAYAAALAGSDDPDLHFGAYALPSSPKGVQDVSYFDLKKSGSC
jgi:hypothetical protein